MKKFNASEDRKEKNSGKIVTVPDMEMSIAEIMRRHVKGAEVTSREKSASFDDEDTDDTFFHVDISKLDLIDREELKKQVASSVEDLRRKAHAATLAAQELKKKIDDQKIIDDQEADEKRLDEMLRKRNVRVTDNSQSTNNP